MDQILTPTPGGRAAHLSRVVGMKADHWRLGYPRVAEGVGRWSTGGRARPARRKNEHQKPARTMRGSEPKSAWASKPCAQEHRRRAKPCSSIPQVRKSLNSCSTNSGSEEPSE